MLGRNLRVCCGIKWQDLSSPFVMEPWVTSSPLPFVPILRNPSKVFSKPSTKLLWKGPKNVSETTSGLEKSRGRLDGLILISLWFCRHERSGDVREYEQKSTRGSPRLTQAPVFNDAGYAGERPTSGSWESDETNCPWAPWWTPDPVWRHRGSWDCKGICWATAILWTVRHPADSHPSRALGFHDHDWAVPSPSRPSSPTHPTQRFTWVGWYYWGFHQGKLKDYDV